MSSDIVIEVENLSKCYQIYDNPRDRLLQMFCWGRKQFFQEFWALRDVSLQIEKGETVGIVGRNGSGKSTLLQLICGTLSPTGGSISSNGRIAALLELGSGFNPEFTGRENVYMNGALLGLAKEEIDARYDDIAAFADIGDFIKQPVKAYSSGMVVRLAFAVMVHVKPQILVIDEALAVGDAAFQRKCIRKIQDLVADDGVSLLFVSHDTETVKKICSRAVYLVNGLVRFIGQAKDVCIEYERDLFGASKGGAARTAETEAPKIPEPALLDPELLVGHEKTYGDGKVVIENIRITTPQGRLVNVIPAGTTFIISYTVKFFCTVCHPIFGMMITTREGICVFGINTEELPVSKISYSEDDQVQISFELINNLGSGVYYLTCGVHTPDVNGKLIFLQRRIDNCLFKSIDANIAVASGLSQLYAKIEVNYR